MVIRYVDAYNLSTLVEDADLALTVLPNCPPHNCSGHGECDVSTKGLCQCDENWQLEEDCSKSEGDVKVTVGEEGKVVLPVGSLGFNVNVNRPQGHYQPGDIIGLYPKSGPFTSKERAAYAYATRADSADLFMMISKADLDAVTASAGSEWVVKYLTSTGQTRGTSTPFVVEMTKLSSITTRATMRSHLNQLSQQAPSEKK